VTIARALNTVIKSGGIEDWGTGRESSKCASVCGEEGGPLSQCT